MFHDCLIRTKHNISRISYENECIAYEPYSFGPTLLAIIISNNAIIPTSTYLKKANDRIFLH